jgi:hypothetical protein
VSILQTGKALLRRMAFNDNVGCPEGWARDEWMQEVPRDATGAFVDGALSCDLPIAGYWTTGAILIFARLVLGLVNLRLLRSVRQARKAKARRRRRGLAPAFDILNTVIVIIFICLAPVTSSRNGVTWVLFGLAFTPYFVGSFLFITKIVRNRLRIAGARGGSSATMPRTNVHIREEWITIFLLVLSIIGIIGAPVTWIIGAAAFGGSVVCHRVALALFCMNCTVSQTLAFSESIKTAMKLSMHLHTSPRSMGIKLNPMKSVRYRLWRSSLTFLPMLVASTVLLICLVAGVLAFHWYVAYILMSIPIVNSTAAMAIFMRSREKATDESSSKPRPLKVDDKPPEASSPRTLVAADGASLPPVTPASAPLPSSFMETKLTSVNES